MSNHHTSELQPRENTKLVLAQDKDYRPALISLTYSWILLFIPTIVMALRIKSTTLRVSETTIHYETGTLTKNFQNIDLYQVHSVGATESVLTGGTIVVTMSDGTKHKLEHIPNAGEISTKFRGLIDKQRRAQNIRSREQI